MAVSRDSQVSWALRTTHFLEFSSFGNFDASYSQQISWTWGQHVSWKVPRTLQCRELLKFLECWEQHIFFIFTVLAIYTLRTQQSFLTWFQHLSWKFPNKRQQRELFKFPECWKQHIFQIFKDSGILTLRTHSKASQPGANTLVGSFRQNGSNENFSSSLSAENNTFF